MTPRPHRSLLFALLALSITATAARANGWQSLSTVDDVCRLYPERVERLWSALDLTRPELAAVREAVDRGDHVAAGNHLLEYYRVGTTASWLRQRSPTEQDPAAAEEILADKFTLNYVADVVPRTESGGLDWRHRGPDGDVEWAFSLNRHPHLTTLLDTYLATGDKRFVRRLDQDLRDWLTFSQPYPGKRTRDPVWRGLEVNFRLKIWSAIFFALQEEADFRPATRLLMLAILPEHAHYLRNFHRAGGNWLVMESAALGELATYWPEFKESADWFAYARQKQEEEITRQVYPDGVQHELTASYHGVTVRNFARFAQVSRRGTFPPSDTFLEQLQRMHDYQARSMRPSGTNPLNSDSDLGDVRPALTAAAEEFGRPDWLYIDTFGQQGQPPAGFPSTIYPWAGQLISRSGWDREAQWSFFDIGPWGSGHQHNDKLHLSIAAHGRDLLVDSGRFAYDGELADRFKSRYARHSRGHNVVLIDGAGQGPGPLRAAEPLAETEYRINPKFDFARGTCDHFAGVEGAVQHTRAVFYVRGRYWIVVDRITTDRPRQIEVLWHFHPDCTPAPGDDQSVATTDPGVGNLRLLPFGGDIPWKVDLVKGQEEPVPQGWYSERYGSHTPSSCAVYSAEVEGSATFAWLTTTAHGDAPRLEALLEEASGPAPVVRIGSATRCVIPLEQGEPALE